MVNSNFPRRRFLKLSASGAIVVVVAGVGAFLALQQPQPSPVPVTPATTPRPSPPPAPAPAAASPSPRPVTPAATPSPTPTPTLVDKANEEGTVMLYSSYDDATVKVILEGFMKKYPKIKTEFVRALSGQLITKYLSEYRAGKHIMDTHVGSALNMLPALEEGIVAQYFSPEVKVFPPELKDPQGLWVTAQFSPQAISYNTVNVKGADVPQTYWDLLKPKFKDKIVVNNPRGLPHSSLITKRKIVGSERWMEWLKGLKAQNPKEILGEGPLNTMLKQGEAHIALWAFTGTATQNILEGAPIDYVRKPNTLLSPPNQLWINKYAPHPNAARLLYDYIISEEGQNLVNDMGKYVMARLGIPAKMGLGIGIGEPIKPEYVASHWPFTQKDLDQVVAEWDSVFPRA